MESATSPQTIYHRLGLKEMARLLSWQDREAFSKTYGCFDRTFWGWKFTDFPGARFQEGIYALAHVFSQVLPDNAFANDARVLTWVRAGLDYWRRIQYEDGSFDEAYPYEHSLAATAFTGFYVGEGFLLIADHLPTAERDPVRRALARAGGWLCRNDERHGVLSNHLAAAAAALETIYQITGDTKYQTRSQYFLRRIYDHQSREGWYEEYGGADPGYQTHATFYLARIWQTTQDPTLLESLRQSVTFLKYWIHPNRTLGGEYASRNTEFYFPAGLEMLASVAPDAAAIAAWMRPAVERQTVAGLGAMDAYNFLPLLNNYLFAARAATEISNPVTLPCQREGEWVFDDAGLVVKSNARYYAVLGLSKGGVLRVYDRETGDLRASDCGYWAQLPGKRTISSSSLTRPAPSSRQDAEFTVTANFAQVNQRVMTPWLFIGFRLFTLTAGRFQSAADWMKNLLVRVLVRRQKLFALKFTRRVCFADTQVTVTDRIGKTGNISVTALRAGSKFATIHMGSSRYFQPQELRVAPDEPTDGASELNQTGHFQRVRVIRFD